ncbi:Ethylene-responsive transcription factor ERF118 [Camellia lanceoleosa]|nr:Ethylene-responsive transcription factor ERF118 [Camellia lanceoleosa]
MILSFLKDKTHQDEKRLSKYRDKDYLSSFLLLGFNLLFIDDFGHLFDDFGSLDDLQIFGFEDNEPSDLPDFDFELGNEEFAWMDGP